MNVPQVLWKGTGAYSGLIAVNKPPHWLSVPPSHVTSLPIVLSWAREQWGRDALPVHRLDVETSGVLLLAVGKSAQALASSWFEGRKIKKHYEFLAAPHPAVPAWRCTLEIGGKSAATRFKILQTYSFASFSFYRGSAQPETGRRHQIRIHASRTGTPLLGDTEYGGLAQLPPPLLAPPRVCLHAAQLHLPDLGSASGSQGPHISAPWPSDLANWQKTLQRAGEGTGE